MNRQKTLVIGWDAADWKAIHPLLDAGLLPNLERLINRGVMGELETLRPALSPMLWTSIATGKRPYKHGIHGFSEVGPTGEVRPVTIQYRQGKALWNILTQENYHTNVVGWWPSHPAEPISGVNISNFYHRSSGSIYDAWPLTKGTVHPKEKEDLYAALRVHYQELTANHLRPFIPEIDTIDINEDTTWLAVAKTLAECSSVHAAATHILEHEPWDFVGVYYDAIDHFKHGFMRYHPPHRPGVNEKGYALYHNVVTAAYQFHDMMLGRLMELAGEEAQIILISDHGFHPDHMRPMYIPQEPSGPAREHSKYGIFVAAGPNIKKDESVYGANLLDVAPTILASLGLPIGRDMDGKPLLSIFETPPNLSFIPSWDEKDGAAGLHEAWQKQSVQEFMDKEALQQLVDLGYIEDTTGGNAAQAEQKTLRENRFNLAQSYMDGQKYEEAIELLEVLYEEDATQVRFGLMLAQAYTRLMETERARTVINALKTYLLEFDVRLRAAQALEDKTELNELLQRRWSPNTQVTLDILEGQMLLFEEKPKQALACFQSVLKQGYQYTELQLKIGRCYSLLGDWAQAIIAYKKELDFNAQSAEAYMYLGHAYLQRKSYEEALDYLWEATRLSFHSPITHYHIGECLYQLAQYQEATQAFRIALKMDGSLNKARLRLIRIYREHLKDEEQAAQWEATLQTHIEDELVIVSGLPRSGTSMMMQILDTAGIPIFSDKKRKADEHNPKGYLEHEAVLRLARDNSWVQAAKGKAVKVVAPLLKFLPDRFAYKVIFMERPLAEVMHSQQRMLAKMGKDTDENEYSMKLQQQFERTLGQVARWGRRRKHVDILKVSYQEVLASPEALAKKLSTFLGYTITVDMLKKVIDPSLYRSRI